MPINPNIRQCLHLKVDGQRCGSPAVRQLLYCFFHQRMRRRARSKTLRLPALEDPAAIQVAINDVLHAMNTDQIEFRKGMGILYGLQLARDNMRHLTTKEAESKESKEELIYWVARRLRKEAFALVHATRDGSLPDEFWKFLGEENLNLAVDRLLSEDADAGAALDHALAELIEKEEQ